MLKEFLNNRDVIAFSLVFDEQLFENDLASLGFFLKKEHEFRIDLLRDSAHLHD
jgi:hypothetical protein